MQAIKTSDLKALLDQLGCPVYYAKMTKPAKLPYIIFKQTGTSNMAADNVVFTKIPDYQVFLMADMKDESLQEQLELIFDNNEIYWEQISENYDDSTKVIEVLYAI